MLFFSLITIILSIGYAIIIQQSLRTWQQLPLINLPADFQPTVFISILIPARNEEENILKCLNSIKQADYPSHLFEIIVIDDHSEDKTASIAESVSDVQLLHLADYLAENPTTVAYKKKAIEWGVKNARGALIVTTDADCVVARNWLKYIACCYEYHQAQLIAGPVLYHGEQSAFERFQSLDYAGTMLFTGASLYLKLWPMANGANLAYSKSLFEKLGGFRGHSDLASGDDVLFVQRVLQEEPESIFFLKQKGAVVHTKAQEQWSGFFSQRLRWGTKNNRFPSVKAALLIGVVFFYSSLIPCLFIASFFCQTYLFPIFLFAFFCKTLCDYLLLRSATDFFDRPELMKGFLISEIYHILYVCVVGVGALFMKNYTWKGRRVK